MRPNPADPGAKPIDLGDGNGAASLGLSSGSLLSLIRPHPRHGVVELTALPPFDEARRGDPGATRAYRRLMTDEGFDVVRLVSADGATFRADDVDLSDPAAPAWTGRIGGARCRLHATMEGGALVMRWRCTAGRAARPVLHLRVSGRLDRPALAAITETDPPQPTAAVTRIQGDDGVLTLSALVLPATATMETDAGAWQVGAVAQLGLDWLDGDGPLEWVVRCTLETGIEPAAAANPGVPAPDQGRRAPERANPALEPIVQRALAYVRDCTALFVAPGQRVLLTDHRILPLSWTRDAYYQALLLLAAGEAGDRERVADHLRWLWVRCDRPDGRWARSHHADGRRKDRPFQADQQLYPLLELADYWRAHGGLPDGVDWSSVVSVAWSAALAEVDPRSGLIASAENAADDPAAAPLIAASQILLWYTAVRLGELAEADAVRLADLDPHAVAARVRDGFRRHIVGGERWWYATDAAGQRVDYHDANDLPVALAPMWGFCRSDDPGWVGTMDFAFSAANGGYVAGVRGGLGSAHTPGPWPLGDIQAWIVGTLLRRPTMRDAALQRLADAAFVDGMLPEAHSADGPDERTRHWFAWPGAALAALLILERRGELGTRLRA